VGPLRYDNNRNVLNKCDDKVRWWLSMGRPKVIIMVPIWKCVGLTPTWSNFPDVHYLSDTRTLWNGPDFDNAYLWFGPIYTDLVIRVTRNLHVKFAIRTNILTASWWRDWQRQKHSVRQWVAHWRYVALSLLVVYCSTQTQQHLHVTWRRLSISTFVLSDIDAYRPQAHGIFWSFEWK